MMRRDFSSHVLPFVLALGGLAVGQGGFASVTEAHAASPDSAAASPEASAAAEAAVVKTLAPMLEGFRWGMTRAEVVDAYTRIGGILHKDYDPLLARVPDGSREQQNLEARRERDKEAFRASWIEFSNQRTGLDTSGIATEYTYKNHEGLLSVARAGKKRFIFFIGAAPSDRLWKVYDEVPLKEGGPLGGSFQEAVSRLGASLGVPGKAKPADAAAHRPFATVYWRDNDSVLRAVDRGGIVAVVLESLDTVNNLHRLRAHKDEDPFALDPSIQAVTRSSISDPNAPSNAPPPEKKQPKGRPPKK